MRSKGPKGRQPQQSNFWFSWKGGLVSVGVVAIIAASFVLPGLGGNKTPIASSHNHTGMIAGDVGTGLKAGSTVPSFSERDLLNGKQISSQTVYGQKTLLFFSEGVMCQACFQQIQGLQEFGAQLHKRGIQLVSVTPDSSSDLEQAAQQYGITTPLIADDDHSMSEAFNTLGKGMHSDTPGHAFVLIDKGKVLWYRDYWLPPYREMYVQPKQLLTDIPS